MSAAASEGIGLTGFLPDPHGFEQRHHRHCCGRTRRQQPQHRQLFSWQSQRQTKCGSGLGGRSCQARAEPPESVAERGGALGAAGSGIVCTDRSGAAGDRLVGRLAVNTNTLIILGSRERVRISNILQSSSALVVWRPAFMCVLYM